jgi:cytochrome c-type biogenesis protein CcmH/NrfG
VSGLAIDKDHREFNLLMANLYERDHAFEKAEFILKELAEINPNDTEVLIRLATVIAMQRKYEIAYEIYKKVLSQGGENEEILYTLTHIASEMTLPDDVLMYAKSYLKQYPKNPEILWLYSQAQITKGERKDAVETLIKLKNLTPYNQEIVDLIGKLVTEEELAGNFGEEKNN